MSELTGKRLYFLDNLKAFIILLMVVFHIAMGYTTWDLAWWTVNDIQKSAFFDFFVLETDVYIMPIMFMIAGYFAPLLLGKCGIQLFLRKKFRRIVIPWIGGVFFLAPFIAYSTFFSRMDTPPELFSFWKNGFWGPYYQQGPYWFLGILALFFLLFTIVYQIHPGCAEKSLKTGFPPVWFFPAFIFLTALSFFVTNLFFWNDTWLNVKFLFMIQPTRIILYLCYFSLGVLAWRHAWFSPAGYNPHPVQWGAAAILMLFVFLAYRVTFTLMPDVPVLNKAGHALVHAAFALTATFALIALFQRFFDSQAYLWRRFAANSYTIYFIHPFIYIPLGCAVQKLAVNIWIKYLCVSTIAVILCFLLSEYLINPVLSQGKREKTTLEVK